MAAPGPLSRLNPTQKIDLAAAQFCTADIEGGWEYQSIFTISQSTDASKWNPLIALILPLKRGWMRKLSIYVVTQTVKGIVADMNVEFYLNIGAQSATEPVAHGIWKPGTVPNYAPCGLLVDVEPVLYNYVELWARLDPATATGGKIDWTIQFCCSRYTGAVTNDGSIQPTYGYLVSKGSVP